MITKALLGDLSKWVPASASRVSYVKGAGTVVGIVGAPNEVVVLHFAVARKHEGAGEGGPAANNNHASSAHDASYTAHPKSYCDDGREPGQHQHAYVSNTDTIAECQQHCTSLNCTCFDFKDHKAQDGRQQQQGVTGEIMYACRVNTIATSLSKSNGGYSAYTLVLPPAPPPPPPPPQLKTAAVSCTVGSNGVAEAHLDTGTMQWQC